MDLSSVVRLDEFSLSKIEQDDRFLDIGSSPERQILVQEARPKTLVFVRMRGNAKVNRSGSRKLAGRLEITLLVMDLARSVEPQIDVR